MMLDDAMRDARERGESIASVLGSLASSVLAVGGALHELRVSGAYPQLAFAGEMPGLSSAVQSSTVHGTPVIELVSGGWEDRSARDSGSRAGALRAAISIVLRCGWSRSRRRSAAVRRALASGSASRPVSRRREQ